MTKITYTSNRSLNEITIKAEKKTGTLGNVYYCDGTRVISIRKGAVRATTIGGKCRTSYLGSVVSVSE